MFLHDVYRFKATCVIDHQTKMAKKCTIGPSEEGIVMLTNLQQELEEICGRWVDVFVVIPNITPKHGIYD